MQRLIPRCLAALQLWAAHACPAPDATPEPLPTGSGLLPTGHDHHPPNHLISLYTSAFPCATSQTPADKLVVLSYVVSPAARPEVQSIFAAASKAASERLARPPQVGVREMHEILCVTQ